MIYRFEKKEHEEYGGHGWLLVGSPSTYEPLSGMGVAHDLLEHKADDDGGIEDECMALGASLYIRGEGGYYQERHPHNRNDAGEQASGDLVRLGMEYGGIENGIAEPGRTTRLDGEIEGWIDSALKMAREEIRGTFEVGEDFKASDLREFLRNVRGWMRKGYRHARRRYKRCSPAELSFIFWQIEKAADELLPRCDEYSELMFVEIKICACDVRVWLDFNEETRAALDADGEDED